MSSVRIVNVDYYVKSPIQGLDIMYSNFRGSSTNHVPVIRIFGSTDTGEKACIHIHGIFPYFYIPYDGIEPPDSLMYQIASNLDKSINISLGQASSNVQHVYNIQLVSGIPFYGYHIREHQFFKIYFYNPMIIKRASTLFQNGNILGKVFQPYECHIPYILQFMIDYNLHGMSYINFSELYYRNNTENPLSNIDEKFLLPQRIQRISVCKIEADAFPEHILNKLNYSSGQLSVNPGITALWEDEKQRRKNMNQDIDVLLDVSQPRNNILPTTSHVVYKQALEQKLASQIQSKSTPVEDFNRSVYPAETPEGSDLLNASSVDSSLLNDSLLDVTLKPNEDSTLHDQTLQNDVKEDSEVEHFLEVLKDLRENVNVEDDSILSQVTKDDSEEESDLSLPLGEAKTPTKTTDFEEKNSENEDDLWDHNSFFDNLQIPQLDGNCEESDDCIETYKTKRKRCKTAKKVCDNKVDLKNSDNRKNKVCKLDRKENYIVDGANDSSSSDDEFVKFHSTKKKHLKNDRARYSPLPVQYKSPNKKINQPETIKNFENDYENNKDNCMQNSKNVKNADTDIATLENVALAEVKRILKFENVSDATQTEKTIVCCLGEENKNINVYIDKTIENEKSKTDAIDNTSKKNSQGSSNSYSSGDLFSPENYNKNETDSFLISDSNKDEEINDVNDKSEVTVANKYDELVNYVPIAGTSKLDSNKSSQKSVEEISDISGTITSQKSNEETSDSSIVSYQKCQLSKLETSKNLNVLDENFQVFVNEETDLSGIKILIPKYLPPSRKNIEMDLISGKIPFVRYQEPFYSNVNDTTAKVEIGNSVLKIPSKSTLDLQEFESSFDGINTFRKINAEEGFPINDMKLLKLSYCSQNSCIVTPVMLPPSRLEVDKWIQSAKSVIKTEPKKIKEKTRILIPLSPGDGNENDSFNETISLSPCTPVENKLDIINATSEDSTPRKSPVLRKRKRKNAKIEAKLDNSSENDSKSQLRKSLLQSHFLNQILSQKSNSCCITGATLNNTHGFRMSLDNLKNARAVTNHQFLTTCVMELHVKTRADLKPNPEFDPIRAIFYSVLNDVPDNHESPKTITGVFVVNETFNVAPENSENLKTDVLKGSGVSCNITYVENEVELLNEFVKFIHVWDPDIFAGYEIEMLSWGYLIERSYVLGLNLAVLLSRIPTATNIKTFEDSEQSELKLAGRIILDVWRLLKHEIALQSYTFESVYYHILHKRIPLFSFKDLTFWWEHPTPIHRHKTVNFYICRVEGILKLIDNLDLIGKTSELARLFGIQFYEVLSRGSQFRVESMMLRLAKPFNYIPVSPSVQQRAKMRAPEYLPLILEPESKFYVDPVIVLDFQSLYPSIIIAYNYCFSTCLGRIEHLGQDVPFEFGATQLKAPKKLVKKLLRKNKLNFSPCGVAYVKSEVRKGILPRMLEEILETRLMVKKSMKEYSSDKTLQRVLHSRQLGLKLIANVTYGYTSANFSGRMPSVEVADSVVSKGRETLQRAINMVENKAEWGARVVYGDTDSMFVLVPGRSMEDAFQIGSKIAEAVTNDNPSPVKLKLEKVYLPCILQTKKRYVGYKYESPKQSEPEYEAKGIETVRRDGCPAVSKMLEKCLRLLFETRDVSLVKKYVLKQFKKILSGRLSIQDLTFAKEFRGFSGYRPGACVPALELARKWTAVDKRNQPRSGERVPYVIVNGSPGLPLIRLVRSPKELLNDSTLYPNEIYYISRVIIPPINRCFSLIGCDLNKWFNEMPRKYTQCLPNISTTPNKKTTIAQYFATTSCAACGQQARSGLCDTCMENPQSSMVILHSKLVNWEKSHADVKLICQSCTGRIDIETCISLDCPVLYRLNQTSRDLQQATFVRQTISNISNFYS